MTKRVQFTIVILAMALSTARAADPPSTLNYQGVLRDVLDKPRTGTFDLVYRFFDAAASGNEILVDSHTGGGGNAVIVTNGLFNVQLGGGTVSDGSGAGTYTSLGQVFRDYTDVWLGISVGAETLSPRVKLQASAYALNASNLQGRPAASFVDTSATSQTKTGQLLVSASDGPAFAAEDAASGSVSTLSGPFYGMTASSPYSGAYIQNGRDSYAYIANNAQGVYVHGGGIGGIFSSGSGAGVVNLAYADTGIEAYGTYPSSAGYFKDSGHAGEVYLAYGDTGILARGSDSAGTFESLGGFTVHLASDAYGVAGQFTSPANFYATLAGYNYGGLFSDGTAATFVELAAGSSGVISNGLKNFVQNHPTDPHRVIVYTALEGAEAGTYTRGGGRIRGGETRVALDPTFALTTDPDVGLTAVVTARSPHADLYVASVSTKELVVRSGAAAQGEVQFDYVVNGLRLGFENQPAIVPSDSFPTATVPTLEASGQKLASQPEDARGSTPFARFAAESAPARSRASDLSGARALIAGINSPEHAAYARQDHQDKTSAGTGAGAPRPPVHADGGPGIQASRGAPLATEGSPASHDAGRPGAAPPAPANPGPGEIPYSFTVPVQGSVETGDLLSNDAAKPGILRLADVEGDPAVIGVVAGPAGSRFTDQASMALAGTVVSCKVDASHLPIAVNDLLVASSTPGFAMSGGPAPRQGTVVGKALEPLASGTGSIRILVMSR